MKFVGKDKSMNGIREKHFNAINSPILSIAPYTCEYPQLVEYRITFIFLIFW